MAKAKGSREEGTPRWHYVVGAVVAVVGLGWTILSHFVTGSAAPAPAIQANDSVVAGRDITGSHIELERVITSAPADASAP